jgi:hypothetical protein
MPLPNASEIASFLERKSAEGGTPTIFEAGTVEIRFPLGNAPTYSKKIVWSSDSSEFAKSVQAAYNDHNVPHTEKFSMNMTYTDFDAAKRSMGPNPGLAPTTVRINLAALVEGLGPVEANNALAKWIAALKDMSD